MSESELLEGQMPADQQFAHMGAGSPQRNYYVVGGGANQSQSKYPST